MAKSYENYASYFGVNRAVNPGIRVLMDFLSNYFYTNKQFKKLNELVSLEEIKKSENLICKETDENIKSSLYQSFHKWVESYGSFYSNYNNNNTKYPLPLTKNLIYVDRFTRDRLRNILYRLLYIDISEEKKNEDMKMIEKFLFNDSNTNSLYTNIINTLDSIIDKTTTLDIENKSSTKNLEDISGISLDDNKNLAYNFREDFELLLTKQVFSKLDIYRKINSFTLLLNFYVTLYVINRAYDEEEVFILAKGSSDFLIENNSFHAATTGNFSNIREKIFKVSEEFYVHKIDERSNNGILKIGIDDNEKLQIFSMKAGDIWPGLKKDLFDRKTQKGNDSLDEFIINYLEVGRENKSIDKKALARAFVESSKKRSSSVRMISSMFTGQGKEARMVYPITSVKYKYYAMSSELTELLLKLFLAGEEKEYATLDMFLSWLETRYGIYIAFSDKLITYLSNNSIKAPSNVEFSQNVQAFINTLDSISAIAKLSDNSHIVYDSGNKGGILWLL